MLVMPSMAKYEAQEADLLVVGGSQSGVMAAIQAARMGVKVVLVSESEWLGGSSIKAGVSAIDGNELEAFQTGLWGEFLLRLAKIERNLLRYGWVSFFTFNPQNGRKVLSDWIKSEHNIIWIQGLTPEKVLFAKDTKPFRKVKGVEFSDKNGQAHAITAKITIDATELGELLALGDIGHRIGWEYKDQLNEASAPKKKLHLMNRYPVQELTWVFYLKDYGIAGQKAPKIPKPAGYTVQKAAKRYWCAFQNDELIKANNLLEKIHNRRWMSKYANAKTYTRIFNGESFLTYGQVSPEYFMINWPKCGNDYSIDIERIFSSDKDKRERFEQEARVYSLWFARYIQDTLGERFGLAEDIFPPSIENNHIGGLAHIPYHREARRMWGIDTFSERDFVYEEGALASYHPESIAIGNYANDHHYHEMARPEKRFKLAPKSFQWGGRYTGKPFSIPYKSLIPVKTDGLLVAEKSFSVSHIANGVSRLQPVCMLLGQAAGAAAALSIQRNTQPFLLSTSDLQSALLNDKYAPPTLVPLFDITPDNPYRGAIQKLILAQIIDFPKDGNFHPKESISSKTLKTWLSRAKLTQKKEQWQNLHRDKVAHLLAKELETEDNTSLKDDTSQQRPSFPWRDYCGLLQQGGSNKTFKLTQIEDSQGHSLSRITPFRQVPVGSAGAVTLNPRTYEQLRSLTQKKGRKVKICYTGSYNHSGAWMLIDEIKEKVTSR